MPTGYTYIITEKPETTLREFILRCARAFGPLVQMRDESLDAPIPTSFPIDHFHARELAVAYRKYQDLVLLSDRGREERAHHAFTDMETHYHELNKKQARDRELYLEMRSQVLGWSPRTSDLFKLRTFMLDQIDLSMTEPEEYKAERLTGEQWYEQQMRGVLHDIAYHAEGVSKEREAVASGNKWLKDLFESLPA